MGIIKFEVDIPNFDKELSINIVLKKDGEVVESISSPSVEPSVPAKTTPAKSRNTKKSMTEKPSQGQPTIDGGIVGNGNMMNIDF